ncbi:DGQHR domain-containing protein [Baaleninema simplex]|uniref:DGQHR domain-containing protein n=1 Tax=Baaleninema simplex TaxID=2862350 RepID=UPI00034B27A4|nr:DGQHR domain-containing protein [Baaleninema simplex]
MTKISKRYFGILLRQRKDSKTVPFFVFVAKAKDVKQWAGIRRIKEEEKGSQRVAKPARIKSVFNFLDASSINTIPNSILLAFEENKARFTPINKILEKEKFKANKIFLDDSFFNECEEDFEFGFLEFSFFDDQPDYEKPALIVDGQHRLYGISAYQNENVPIVIVGLIDATLQEQAFQFVVINKKAVSVSTENIKSILADFDTPELEKRLAAVSITYGNAPSTLKHVNDSSDSPFYHLLDWSYNRDDQEGKHLVPITAIEQCFRYIRKIFDVLENDEDSLREFFYSIWKAVQKVYPELWGEDNKLMKKVSVNALNEYIVDYIQYLWPMDYIDIYDPESVEGEVERLLKNIPRSFWISEWSIKVQDNSNVRELIKEDLKTMSSNAKAKKRAWSDNLELPKLD